MPIKAIIPSELERTSSYQDTVILVFNFLIAANFDGQRSVFTCQQATEIMRTLGFDRETIMANPVRDFSRIYPEWDFTAHETGQVRYYIFAKKNK